MKIYDITQQIPDCEIYPGDPRPKVEKLSSMEVGDLYNLTKFSMCAHNGTHVDAPCHFFSGGKSVESIPLSKVIGIAYVAECHGKIDGEKVRNIGNKLRRVSGETILKLLIKGDGIVTGDGAKELTRMGIELIGSETQSVGDENAPMEVHKILLEKDVALLEGVRLKDVPEGQYFLCAAPLPITGADGAPCRALLIDFTE